MTVLQPSPRSPGNGYLVEERRFPFSNSSQLFLASFLTLYFEVLVIRYLTSEVRVFANLKNFLLIASFFGIGLGIMLGASTKSLRRALPLIVILLFLPIRFAKKSDGDVLVIDDWAMAPLSEPERREFWEICEDRYSQSSSASLAQTKSFTNSLSVSQSTGI